LLKQSKQKDYYKIVGVSRDADAKTIKKALYGTFKFYTYDYLTPNSRKSAKSAHPDKGGSEAKMALLNEAYEVLSNPELRSRFDNGEDPMDPMAQQGGNPFSGFQGGGGGHPFAQFFQQQQGGMPKGGQGGFQFHFSHGQH
jgi:DnaJ homolog subfamily C member 3